MSVAWDGYSPFDPGVNRPLHELPRREARKAFDRLMAAKNDRKASLGQLLAANGVTLDDSDDGIQRLDDWFRDNVEGNARVDRLENIWYAVVNDISLFLGDTMIKRSPNLRWEFFTKGKRDVGYQRHVILGYTKVADPYYYVDIDMVVATYGVRIVANMETRPDMFVAVLAESEAYA
ncbi:hypothetical protein Acy02nite_82490 [Actinoplanes cyaneus]|uniref:Uncharacterized protein n=1 Tax=Actinoplanes cyaneus TaxID=52696 RepID=A0A919IS05_9ACTN|nr:hypothetical protein [Actinoplanes cyaneus]GID70368.1 hypothetical protein Acy02nite_82490 [Actinoplanes cyaneus]